MDISGDIRATVKREDGLWPSRPQRLICSRRRSYIPATVTTSIMSLDIFIHIQKNCPFHVRVSSAPYGMPSTALCKALLDLSPGHTYRKTAHFAYVSHQHRKAYPLQHTVRHFSISVRDTRTQKPPFPRRCLRYPEQHLVTTS